MINEELSATIIFTLVYFFYFLYTILFLRCQSIVLFHTSRFSNLFPIFINLLSFSPYDPYIMSAEQSRAEQRDLLKDLAEDNRKWSYSP
jgi:hypothetical protein